MYSNLAVYLPQDRLRALARGEPLPNHTTGAALFADISGFTPLTEKLTQTLGPRRGIEELTRQINAVYEALIAEVERFGGSVIGFAGDAITCWFDDNLESGEWRVENGDDSLFSTLSSSRRAVTSAFALQTAMQQFPNLGLKVAVTSGPARRFVVGNPEIQYWDTLAGNTIARLATAEHLAHRGDIVVDEASYHAVAGQVQVGTWHIEESERFAVLASLDTPVPPTSLPSLEHEPSADELCAWINSAVFAREQAGQGIFLTELRPTTALFMRFTGIDFETDTAGDQLDTFLRRVQAVIQRYDGTLIQLTIGDKGSYLYAAFGAPVAHEDDSRRAVKVAVELRTIAQETPFLNPVQIGLTRGTMRTGAYGSSTRRTYGVLGDDVNLAARLMTLATPGQILVSQRVHDSTTQAFLFDALPAVRVKGKTKPLLVFAVLREQIAHALRLQEPVYTLPMVGRAIEFQTITEKLDTVLEGKGQLIGILAEAGMGKSRLVAEVIRLARGKGFVGYGGACQSDGVNTPYLVWRAVWSAFFDVDSSRPLSEQIQQIEKVLENLAPTRLQSLPLLGVLLNLDIPENAFTQTLEPKYRQSALRALLEDCLRVVGANHASSQSVPPLLIVLEDLHWIDALSLTLLEELAQGLYDSRIGFVLAYRPLQMGQTAARFQALVNFTNIELPELTAAEAAQALGAKLTQLYPTRGGGLPSAWVEQLTARAQGNPFYLEELLNYLHDRGLDPFNPADLDKIELPDSLHTLILSRIDQLTEREKTTLRVASIIGRLFRAAWLTGYYPDLGELPHVKTALDQLAELDITPLDTPEPELAYLFKHIVTHEVTYESLPFATRARLHEQLARYLEHTYAEHSPVEMLAFHYGHSDNTNKQREYFRKAGEAAKRNYANVAALDFYRKLLPLLSEEEKVEIHMQRGQVLELMGMLAEAEGEYHTALGLSEQKKDDLGRANARLALGKLSRVRSDFEPALVWLEQAKEGYQTLNDHLGLAQTLIETGTVFWRKGEHGQTRAPLNQGLMLTREAGDKGGMALALNTLGNVAWAQGDYPAAKTFHEDCLVLRREMGDKYGVAMSLNNVGNVAWSQGDFATVKPLYEESLGLRREIGDKVGIGMSLNNLGNVALVQGDYTTAQKLYEESLVLKREMGEKAGIAMSLSNLGHIAYDQGDHAKARVLHEESLSLKREMGEKTGIAMSLITLGNIVLAQGDYPAARAFLEECLALCHEMGEKTFMAYALLGLGLVGLAEGAPIDETRQHILESLRLRHEAGEQLPATSSLVGMAGLAMQAGNALRAAQWLSAVASALQSLKTPMEGEMIAFHAKTLASVREVLGEVAFQSAWEEGSQWSLEEAVHLALDESK